MNNREKWQQEFDRQFVRRAARGFQYELMDPDHVKDFIRRTLGELLADVPDVKLRARLAASWV